jgi:hypothetical protein
MKGMKSRRMRWTEHLAPHWRECVQCFVESQTEADIYEDLDIGWWIILMWTSMYDIGFISLRIEASGRLL